MAALDGARDKLAAVKVKLEEHRSSNLSSFSAPTDRTNAVASLFEIVEALYIALIAVKEIESGAKESRDKIG